MGPPAARHPPPRLGYTCDFERSEESSVPRFASHRCLALLFTAGRQGRSSARLLASIGQDRADFCCYCVLVPRGQSANFPDDQAIVQRKKLQTNCAASGKPCRRQVLQHRISGPRSGGGSDHCHQAVAVAVKRFPTQDDSRASFLRHPVREGKGHGHHIPRVTGLLVGADEVKCSTSP